MSDTSKKIALSADHAGFEMKQALISHVENMGYTVTDLGTTSDESVDYPDFGYKMGQAITNGDAPVGIVVCGSGIGISIAVNRFEKARCALCYSTEGAEMARRHNDANVLALGSRMTDLETARKIVDTFLKSEFEGGRHARRVEKLGSCS